MPTPTPSSSPPTSPPPPPPTTAPSSTTTPPLRPIFLTLLLACPLLMLLPPRKLDLYTFSLAGAWVVSAEEVTFGSARRRGAPISFPAFGRDREREQQQQMQIDGAAGSERLRADLDGKVEEGVEKGHGDEGRGDGEKEGAGVKGLAKKLWMGDERPGWQKRRLERERAELERGKSYGDIIMEQVREVFPGFGGRRGRREDDGEDRDGDGEGKEG